MRNAFLYPLTSRARDVMYISPPAPITPDAEPLTGPIECSSRQGTTYIIGFSSFEYPPGPRQKFRRHELSGTSVYEVYAPNGEGTCGELVETITKTYSGYGSVDSITSEYTHNEHMLLESSVRGVIYDGPGDYYIEQFDWQTTIDSLTNRITVDDFQCHEWWDNEAGVLAALKVLSVSFEENLSEPDTDVDASLRLFPDPTTGWSPYETPSQGCCTARIEARGDGETHFSLREVRYRVLVYNKIPGSAHTIAVEYMRRVDGSGAVFELHSTEELDAVTGGDGTLEFTGLIPNAIGFETYVRWEGSAPGVCSNYGSGGSGGTD